MAKIYLETWINAPVELVFDLARSIDLHKLTTKGTNEEAVAGRTTGLIELGETVTWRAKHFGIYQKLTVVITDFQRPYMFADEMTKGAFDMMKHIHLFEEVHGGTKMIDSFEFKAPLGIFGTLAERFFLTAYMTRFLHNRNAGIKLVAENIDSTYSGLL